MDPSTVDFRAIIQLERATEQLLMGLPSAEFESVRKLVQLERATELLLINQGLVWSVLQAANLVLHKRGAIFENHAFSTTRASGLEALNQLSLYLFDYEDDEEALRDFFGPMHETRPTDAQVMDFVNLWTERAIAASHWLRHSVLCERACASARIRLSKRLWCGHWRGFEGIWGRDAVLYEVCPEWVDPLFVDERFTDPERLPVRLRELNNYA